MNNPHHNDTENQIDSTNTTNTTDTPIDSPARRDALAKIAIMAAWTAPTLTVLMRSKRASATSAHSENVTPDTPQNY